MLFECVIDVAEQNLKVSSNNVNHIAYFTPYCKSKKHYFKNP